MTPQQKVDEYLSEFSVEKSIDLAETMKWYAEEFNEGEWVGYWDKVILILKSMDDKPVLKTSCCGREYHPDDGTVEFESWIAGYPSIHYCKQEFGCKKIKTN